MSQTPSKSWQARFGQGAHALTESYVESLSFDQRLWRYDIVGSVALSALPQRITAQKFFPGYVLVEMDMTDDAWQLVKSTPKVTGFVGSGTRPSPLAESEVRSILRQMEEGAEKPKPKSVFQKGDKVRVIEGPFVNFSGVIEDMSPERGKLKVMVQIFGRLTPVELEYYQVERA
jgi:transcriptional antiterminator NusG